MIVLSVYSERTTIAQPCYVYTLQWVSTLSTSMKWSTNELFKCMGVWGWEHLAVSRNISWLRYTAHSIMTPLRPGQCPDPDQCQQLIASHLHLSKLCGVAAWLDMHLSCTFGKSHSWIFTRFLSEEVKGCGAGLFWPQGCQYFCNEKLASFSADKKGEVWARVAVTQDTHSPKLLMIMEFKSGSSWRGHSHRAELQPAVESRASNNSSRRFHNHGEGPY